MNPSLKDTINGLRAVQRSINAFLARGLAARHRGMWEAAPGIWISNDFRSFDEAVAWLNTL